MQQAVGILGTGSFLPDKKVTNFDLEKLVDTSDEWITTRTGIKERRVTSAQEASSDLAYQASLRALEQAGLKAEDLDLIVVATSTPDMFFPSTACIVQDRLGANKAAAFDVSAACAGFSYGVATGAQFVQTGLYKHVLVVGVDVLTKALDWQDRNTCVLFGDGAGAVVLGPVEQGFGFLSFELGADGSGGDLLKIPGGGYRLPASIESLESGEHFIKMNGREVFKFAVRVMEQVSMSVLEKAGLAKEDVSWLIPHQANLRIIEAARKRLELSEEQVVVNLDKYGNMSSASIPVALDEACRAQRFKKGDIMVLIGFGAGLTWGGSVLRWNLP